MKLRFDVELAREPCHALYQKWYIKVMAGKSKTSISGPILKFSLEGSTGESTVYLL